MSGIVLIGDVHGKYDQYKRITSVVEYTVQLGDMGFSYGELDIDPDKHKFLAGNHDNYTTLLSYPPRNYLGRFGTFTLNNISFFYISGGFSIDESRRREEQKRGGQSWWWQEEMHFEEMLKCYSLFLREKPDILLSHSPPRSVIDEVCGSKTIEEFGFPKDYQCQTSSFIEYLLKAHHPKVCFHGHLHKEYCIVKEKGMFVGLPELGMFHLTNDFLESL